MLKDMLKENQTAITERWLADTLASYQPGAAEFFQRNKDPFANPVGHALVKGIDGVFECLIGERPIESARRDLDGIVKIRAVQDLSPSQALSFVFLLKNAVRTALGKKIDNPELEGELVEFESKVDRIALLAFDIYVNYRERVYRLRVDEVRRNVSAIMARFGKMVTNADPAPEHCSGENES